jgi:hypothetical protein
MFRRELPTNALQNYQGPVVYGHQNQVVAKILVANKALFTILCVIYLASLNLFSVF